MLQWQSRRFAVLTASITIVVGVLGLDGVLAGDSALAWWLVTALVWFFLGASAALTWYAERANARLAAYCIVFHEAARPGWESRLLALQSQPSAPRAGPLDGVPNLNRMICLIYCGLAVLSALLPWAGRPQAALPPAQAVALTLSGMWMLGFFYALVRTPPKALFVKQFRALTDSGESSAA